MNQSDVNLITLVSGIEYKVRELTDRLEKVNQEKAQLQNTIQQLTNELNELNIKYKQLQQTNQIIKLAKAIERERGAGNAKTLVNELIREIDRCIGLLND